MQYGTKHWVLRKHVPGFRRWRKFPKGEKGGQSRRDSMKIPFSVPLSQLEAAARAKAERRENFAGVVSSGMTGAQRAEVVVVVGSQSVDRSEEEEAGASYTVLSGCVFILGKVGSWLWF